MGITKYSTRNALALRLICGHHEDMNGQAISLSEVTKIVFVLFIFSRALATYIFDDP